MLDKLLSKPLVGTNNPQSKLQVTGDAIQLDNNQKLVSKNGNGNLGNMIYRGTDGRFS